MKHKAGGAAASRCTVSAVHTGEETSQARYLFTTKTCPNCRVAKEALSGLTYVAVDAEENMELAAQYGVMQAPTLVVVGGDSFRKYVNASNIKKYAAEQAAVI